MSTLVHMHIYASTQVDRDVNPTQLDTPRSLTSSLQQIQEIQAASSLVRKAALRTEYGIKETPNPMLSLPVDLFQ